jgi:hypothetical protein
MHLLPSTPKRFKRTCRDLFARRMSMMDRPLIIFQFKGLLADHFLPSFWFSGA